MRTATVTKIKGLLIQTQQNTFVLFTLFKLTLDECKTLTKILTRKPLTTVPQTSAYFEGTRKPANCRETGQKYRAQSGGRKPVKSILQSFPPESREKAFEQIYEILQVLDAYLIDNPQQHIHCMSPDNEYVSLIMYAVTIEIDLCNFLAIWAVFSILLDTQSNTLQHVNSLQQVVNNYYDKCPTDVVNRLEHQADDIMKTMYDSINNDNFDSISGDTDRVLGVVDNDYDANDYDKDEHVMPYDKNTEEVPYDSDNENMIHENDNAQMPAKYANDYETVSDIAKYDENMKNDESNDVDKRDNGILTKDKRLIETSDIDNDFMREYDEMHKLMEYKQTYDYYEAQRHIQSAMEGDTLVKTSQNRQYIDIV